MSEKRRQYTDEFKRDAVSLVTEKGYRVTGAVRNLGINAHMQGRWKRQAERQSNGSVEGNDHVSANHEDILRSRKAVKRLRMKREILKKAALFSQRIELKDVFISVHQESWSVSMLCEVLGVGRSGF